MGSPVSDARRTGLCILRRETFTRRRRAVLRAANREVSSAPVAAFTDFPPLSSYLDFTHTFTGASF